MNARISQIQLHLASVRAGVAKTSGTTTSSASGTSFASAYADALGTTSTATPTSSAGLATLSGLATKVDAKGIPLELKSYGNGKIPANALGSVAGTSHKLWAPAAQNLTQLIADAKKDGVTIGITDSYRPYAEQVDLAKRKGLYSQGGLAAKPGTSEHGWGMATDLDLDSKGLAWMRANGKKYGFVEDTPRESWHWAFKVNGS